jgi:hypothetical protein
VGYDFEWAELPEPAMAARERYQTCLDRCNHFPPCDDAYSILAEPFQFHLNMMGMGLCRAGMRRTAMTYLATPQSFPTVAGMSGIPEFKLGSNDSWHVNAQEINQALGRYEAASAALRCELEADQVWQRWLAWLRETADHGGFIVD